jgi:hypothetical protein
MSCIGQLDLGAAAADQSGALDDPAYITGNGQPPDATAGTGNMVESANVAVLSGSAAASLLAQYVSLNVAPGGLGEPGPLQYLLSTHTDTTDTGGTALHHARDAMPARAAEHPGRWRHG